MTDEQIAELYVSGKSIADLETIVGKSRPTIKKILVRSGVKLRTPSQVLLARSKQDRRLYDYQWMYDRRITKRMSIEAIAAELGTNFKYVKTALKYLGIPTVRYNESDRFHQLNTATLVNSLYIDDNLRIREIADILQCSPATVSRFVAKHGIDVRPANSYDRPKSFVSVAENEIADIIRHHGFDVVQQHSIDGTSFDIFVPARRILIEYNGIHWHSDRYKPKTLHLDKTNCAINSQLTLLHVWEDDWRFNRHVVVSMIRHKLGVTETKIDGRKLASVEIDHRTAKEFFDTNHIQRHATAKVTVALVDDRREIMFAASFRKPRFNRHCDWELVRMATKTNIAVRGGASKALKYFRRNYPGSIVSYADRSYSDGGIYRSLGFAHVRTNPISYWYVVNGRRVPRTQFRKSALPPSTLTELQITDAVNIPRIWNAGIDTFVLKASY